MDVFIFELLINQDTIGLLRLYVLKQFVPNDIDEGLKYFFNVTMSGNL